MHLLPKPAEEEFALGYLGRLAHLNSAKSANVLLRDLAKTFGVNARSANHLTIAAKAAGLSGTDLLRAHTLAPAIVSGQDVLKGRLRSSGGIFRPRDNLYPLRLLRGSAYFCSACTAEQKQVCGFGYWHRVHQLPGIHWCPWHKTPLSYCDGRYITEKLPSWSLPAKAPPTEVCKAIENPTLNRYICVLMDFLYGAGPIDKFELYKLLLQTAKKKGINGWAQHASQPFLSDIVFDVVPEWWLQDVCPVSEKLPGKFFRAIDDAIVQAGVSTQVYALAVAILMDGDPPDFSAARRKLPIMCFDDGFRLPIIQWASILFDENTYN